MLTLEVIIYMVVVGLEFHVELMEFSYLIVGPFTWILWMGFFF